MILCNFFFWKLISTFGSNVHECQSCSSPIFQQEFCVWIFQFPLHFALLDASRNWPWSNLFLYTRDLEINKMCPCKSENIMFNMWQTCYYCGSLYTWDDSCITQEIRRQKDHLTFYYYNWTCENQNWTFKKVVKYEFSCPATPINSSSHSAGLQLLKLKPHTVPFNPW